MILGEHYLENVLDQKTIQHLFAEEALTRNEAGCNYKRHT